MVVWIIVSILAFFGFCLLILLIQEQMTWLKRKSKEKLSRPRERPLSAWIGPPIAKTADTTHATSFPMEAQTMSQAYADPTRANDPYALPDVEVFYCTTEEFVAAEAGTWQAERLTDEEADSSHAQFLEGWYYWFCSPGCLPDSDPVGPFATEEDALINAQGDMS